MEIILIITTFILFETSYHSERYKRSMLTCFLLIWFLIVFLYSFRFYGLYNTSDSTFKMYLIGILSFFWGYVSVRYPRGFNGYKYKYIDKKESIKNNILIFLSIVSLVVFILKTIKAIPFWIYGVDIGNLKTAIIMENALSLGSIGETVYTFVARPMCKIMVIYTIILLLQNNKSVSKKKYLLLSLSLVFFDYLSSGSKTVVSQVIFTIFGIIYLFTSISIKTLFKKYRKFCIISLVLVLFVLFVMSLSGDGLLKSLYIYFVGCLPCSDISLARISDSPCFYGLTTFNGLIRVLSIPFNLVGFFPHVKIVLDWVFEYVQQFEDTIFISPDTRYNAFVSLFTYFYMDGGYFGVFILSFLFGLLCSLTNRWAFQKPSYKSIALCLLLFSFIITSMVRFQLFLGPNVVALLLIYLFFPKTNISFSMGKKFKYKAAFALKGQLKM